MSSHTPGPWVKDGIHWIGSNGDTVVVSDGPDFGSKSTFDSAEANSRLIKESPSLLEHLEALTEWAKDIAGDCSDEEQ